MNPVGVGATHVPPFILVSQTRPPPQSASCVQARHCFCGLAQKPEQHDVFGPGGPWQVCPIGMHIVVGVGVGVGVSVGVPGVPVAVGGPTQRCIGPH